MIDVEIHKPWGAEPIAAEGEPDMPKHAVPDVFVSCTCGAAWQGRATLNPVIVEHMTGRRTCVVTFVFPPRGPSTPGVLTEAQIGSLARSPEVDITVDGISIKASHEALRQRVIALDAELASAAQLIETYDAKLKHVEAERDAALAEFDRTVGPL